jgi:5-methylcytosine-specific restriction endonuclease McrA
MSWFCTRWRSEDYRILEYYKSRIGKNVKLIDETRNDPDADDQPLSLPPGALIENQYYRLDVQDLITAFPICKTLKPKRRAFTKWERSMILSIKGKECSECGKQSYLQIHHIDNDRTNDNLSNLQILCDDCHKDIHVLEK